MVSHLHVNDRYFAGWILHDGTIVAEKVTVQLFTGKLRYNVSRSSIYILFAEVY